MNLQALVLNAAVLPVLVFLAAVALHLLSGILLHAFRLRDFTFAKIGNFVETDMATLRGLAILVTFLLSISTLALPTSLAAAKVAYAPAWLALVGSCGAATLPIVRDSVYNLVQLFTGVRPGPPIVSTTRHPLDELRA